MIYEILNGETVVNTIVADAEFMAANYPAGNYREVPEPVPVPVLTWIVTRNAFQNRFPMTANGVSTKYDLMTLFLTDTGYAESLGVTGSDLYSLRSIIITGNNRLGVVANVDLQAQETIGYVNMTTNAAFPEVFRLTAAEASAILDTPAEPNETP
jgi:hypothetical protein